MSFKTSKGNYGVFENSKLVKYELNLDDVNFWKIVCNHLCQIIRRQTLDWQNWLGHAFQSLEFCCITGLFWSNFEMICLYCLYLFKHIALMKNITTLSCWTVADSGCTFLSDCWVGAEWGIWADPRNGEPLPRAVHQGTECSHGYAAGTATWGHEVRAFRCHR